jgi:hypothetical protein
LQLGLFGLLQNFGHDTAYLSLLLFLLFVPAAHGLETTFKGGREEKADG